jgi:hypothetical protein
MLDGTPLNVFQNPMHAVWLVGFGVVFFLIATGIRLAATYKDKLFGASTENPSQSQRKGRLLTAAEFDKAMSPALLSFMRGFGRLGQLIGIALVSAGLLGLVASSADKFF